MQLWGQWRARFRAPADSADLCVVISGEAR
jgi:hypothetical protein